MVNTKLALTAAGAVATVVTSVAQPVDMQKQMQSLDRQQIEQQRSRQTRELNSATRDKGRTGTSGKK